MSSCKTCQKCIPKAHESRARKLKAALWEKALNASEPPAVAAKDKLVPSTSTGSAELVPLVPDHRVFHLSQVHH